jgi:hypothetical protein
MPIADENDCRLGISRFTLAYTLSTDFSEADILSFDYAFSLL